MVTVLSTPLHSLLRTPGILLDRVGGGRFWFLLAGVLLLASRTIDAQSSLIATDVPQQGQIVSGSISFSGWAMDSQSSIAVISYTIDGINDSTAQYGSSRTDVCSAIGQYPGCPNVGWSLPLDTTQLPDGPHVLAITAVTSDGRSTIINREFATSNSISGAVYEIVNKLSDKVLDVSGASPNNGTIIQQWDFNGGGQQKWLLVPTDSQYYKIVNQLTGKVLDVTGSSTSDGALIQEYDDLGNDNQKWAFVPVGGGYFEIVSKLDGKVLDDTGVATTNGSYIQQWDALGGDNQLWRLAVDGSIPVVEGSTQSTQGYTSDGSVSALSILTVAGGNATTYSQTVLDYGASLYYDPYTEAFLFDNGTVMTSAAASSSGTSPAALGLTSFVYPWHDYQLQSSHFVVAWFVGSAGYYDAYGYSEGAYTGDSGDVTFDETGVAVWLDAEYIYLSSTIADQIYVPQDTGGVIPLVDVTSYESFAPQAGQTDPPSASYVEAWNLAIKLAIKSMKLAAAQFKAQAGSAVSPYPLPMFLQVVRDAYSSTSPPVERDISYTLRDSDGLVWDLATKAVRIDEIITNVSTGSDPPPPANPYGWTNGVMKNEGNVLFDTHSTQSIYGPKYQYFWQQYYATQYSAPGFSPPGVVGLPTNAIPLMLFIQLPSYPSTSSCGLFGIQAFSMTNYQVSINGDSGPPSNPTSPVCVSPSP